MLPGLDGFGVCQLIRDQGNTPIIIMSARVDKQDKIAGLELGADDYVEKPFDIDVLSAKIGAQLRRSYEFKEKLSVISDGDITIDLNAMAVYFKKNPLIMTAKEYDMLLLFLQNKGKTLRKEWLFDKVWGTDSFKFFAGKNVPRLFEYTIQPIFKDHKLTGYIRFIYSSDNQPNLLNAISILNISLLIMSLMIIITLFFIKNSILKPFNEIVQLPYELSKGHFKMETKESKNRFFGKFLWGLDLLRESLEGHKRRELQLEKEKKTLILSISHDIKTPLSTIKLYSKAIYDNLYESGEGKAEAARQIEQKADQIESFVEEIIATSTENLLDIILPGEFYLTELINRIGKTYMDKLKLIRTEFCIDHFEDVLLEGDIERLIEVFENIIENAIKYGDGKYIKITFADEDYCKLITVTNSGQPLPGTEFIHMIESFWRGANSHNKNGSGLGLYICKEIMKKMDGDIFTSSTKDSMSLTVVVRYS